MPDPRLNVSTPNLAHPRVDIVESTPACSKGSIAKGALLAVGAGCAAGVSFPLISISSRDVGPFASACLMQTGAALVAWTAAGLVPQDGRSLRTVRKGTAGLLAIGAACGAVIAPATMVMALHEASASGVSLMSNVEPFMAALAAWPLFRQRPNKFMAIAGSLAIGSGVLCTIGQFQVQSGSAKGIGIAAASSAAWAGWDLVLFGLRDMRCADVVGVGFTLGAASCGILGGALRETFPHDSNVAKLLGCGALAFGVTDTLISLALRYIGVGRASLMCVTVGVVVGTTVSHAMGQGAINPLIGASLGVAILGSVILASEHFAPSATPPAARPTTPAGDLEMAIQ